MYNGLFKTFDLLYEFPAGPRWLLCACLPLELFGLAVQPRNPHSQWEKLHLSVNSSCSSYQCTPTSKQGWLIWGGAGRISPAIDLRGNVGQPLRGDGYALLEPLYDLVLLTTHPHITFSCFIFHKALASMRVKIITEKLNFHLEAGGEKKIKTRHLHLHTSLTFKLDLAGRW